MAQSEFSSKPSSERARKQSLLVARVFHTLGFRIFVIGLAFLVLPLLIHFGHAFYENQSLYKKELFIEMCEIAKGRTRLITQFFNGKFDELGILDAIVAEVVENGTQQPGGVVSAAFREAVFQNYVSYIFVETLNVQGDLNCILGAPAQLSSCVNLFRDQIAEVMKSGKGVFVAEDPISHLKHLYISRAVMSTQGTHAIGAVTIAVKPQSWFDTLSRYFTPEMENNFFIVDSSGATLLSNDPNFSLRDTTLFSVDLQEDIILAFHKNKGTKEGVEFLKFFSSEDSKVGIKVPIPNTELFFVASRPYSSFYRLFSAESLGRAVKFLIFYALIGGFFAVWLTHRMSKPLRDLCNTMEKVGRGDIAARYPYDKMGFEINVLGLGFNEMIKTLLETMEAAKNERIARELLGRELKIGQEIQRSLLPREIPEFPELDIAAAFFSASEVGGDFYDIFVRGKDNNKQLVIAIADAAGKGVSACLYSLGVRSMLRSYGVSSGSLAQMIIATNNLFCLDAADTGAFVTAWVGILDPKSKKLQFSCNGHLPALLLHSNGVVEELTTPGIALGAMPIDNVHSLETQLSVGDELYLFTDGLIEAENSQGEVFSKKRLIELLKTKKIKGAKGSIAEILKQMDLFCKGCPQRDDITILAICIPSIKQV